MQGGEPEQRLIPRKRAAKATDKTKEGSDIHSYIAQTIAAGKQYTRTTKSQGN